MYPVKLGYKGAIKRIKKLIKNGHHAEALVTSMFTVEKTLRRTLRQIVVSAGFTSKHADQILSNLKGLDALKNVWELYDPKNSKLIEIINTEDWQLFKDAALMRNRMVHGVQVYKLELCKKKAESILEALERLKTLFDNRYEYNSWQDYKSRKKHRLHIDPYVKL